MTHAYLQGQQQQESLNRVVAAIDKVAHEQVVCLGHIAPDFEQFFEIVELPVDVAAHLNREQDRRNVKAADAYINKNDDLP